jgi:hypothetical protein
MDVPAIIKSSIPKAVLKEKGDLATAKSDGQLDTMPVGPDGTVLTADSTQSTGFKWDSAPAAKANWGSITGNLSNQTDLEDALNSKQNALGFTPVPNTTQVNGQALTGNVTLSNSDIGLGKVSNDAQLKRSAGDINSFPLKSLPIAGDILLGEDSANGYTKIKIPINGLLAGDSGTTFSIDGGNASTVYGGVTSIDGGNA